MDLALILEASCQFDTGWNLVDAGQICTHEFNPKSVLTSLGRCCVWSSLLGKKLV